MTEDFSSKLQALRQVNPQSIDQERAERAERLRTRNGVTRTKSVEKSEHLLGSMRQGLRKTRRPEQPKNKSEDDDPSETGSDPKCPWGKARAPPSQHLLNLLAWDQKHAEKAAARVYASSAERDGSVRPKLIRRNSETNFVSLLANIRRNLRHVKPQPYVPPLPWTEFVALRKTNHQKEGKPAWEMEKVLLRKTRRPQRRHSFPIGPDIQLKKTLMHQEEFVREPSEKNLEDSQNETDITEVLSEDEMTNVEAVSLEAEPVQEEVLMPDTGDEEIVDDQGNNDPTSRDEMDESKRLEEKLADQQRRLAQVHERDINQRLIEEISVQKARDILMWYARLDQPNKEAMKRKVGKLPRSCDITVEDIEILPWICKDHFLDISVMNKLFLQGGLSG